MVLIIKNRKKRELRGIRYGNKEKEIMRYRI
jgi:hypothetical protein